MLREPRVAGERRKQRAQPRVVGQQIVDQRRRFGYRGPHKRKKYLFLGFEMPHQILIEERGELGRALLQARGTHRLQTAERLLPAAEREREAVMVIVRERDQARMARHASMFTSNSPRATSVQRCKEIDDEASNPPRRRSHSARSRRAACLVCRTTQQTTSFPGRGRRPTQTRPG